MIIIMTTIISHSKIRHPDEAPGECSSIIYTGYTGSWFVYAEIYGSERENTVFCGNLQSTCLLQKSPRAPGSLRESVI